MAMSHATMTQLPSKNVKNHLEKRAVFLSWWKLAEFSCLSGEVVCRQLRNGGWRCPCGKGQYLYYTVCWMRKSYVLLVFIWWENESQPYHDNVNSQHFLEFLEHFNKCLSLTSSRYYQALHYCVDKLWRESSTKLARRSGWKVLYVRMRYQDLKCDLSPKFKLLAFQQITKLTCLQIRWSMKLFDYP